MKEQADTKVHAETFLCRRCFIKDLSNIKLHQHTRDHHINKPNPVTSKMIMPVPPKVPDHETPAPPPWKEPLNAPSAPPDLRPSHHLHLQIYLHPHFLHHRQQSINSDTRPPAPSRSSYLSRPIIEASATLSLPLPPRSTPYTPVPLRQGLRTISKKPTVSF